MARIRPLARAPIVEALVDLRVQAGEGKSSEAIDKAVEGLDFGYQKKGPILRGHFGFSINPQETPAARAVGETTIIGVRLLVLKCIVLVRVRKQRRVE